MAAFHNFAKAPKNVGVFCDVEGNRESCDAEDVPVCAC
jgi:hypothetical protein